MLKRCIFIPAIWTIVLVLWASPAFAQSVDTAWVRRYNGPGDSTDYAHAIAVDGSGNVYVTGASYDTESYLDYATIKYYASGDTAWVRRYNGTENGDDYAEAIAVDESGNVYVTGISGYVCSPVLNGGDYITIKYYPDGDTAWLRKYNGPEDSTDWAHAIAIDDSGNVYVTGCSGDSYGGVTTPDYVTIKYSPNGDTAWVRRYDGPASSSDVAYAIAVDGSGNIYVTGESYGSGTNYDYATIKYDPNGDTAWVKRYNGPVDAGDGASDISVDGSGNVYVTGYSWGSGTSNDYATIKYYASGDTAWVRRYSGPGDNPDEAYSIAIDSSSNIYVTGYSRSGTWDDYVTIKYYPDGDTAWVRRYDGPGNFADRARAIAVDGSGNLYVTGGSYGIATTWDYATIKYYASGHTAWVRRYNGPGNVWDKAYAIAVDGSGNVYVTGESWGSGTAGDYVTIKYVQFLAANFSADPDSGLPPLSVQFTDLSVGGPNSWLWHFGDGDSSMEQNPVHEYSCDDTGYFDVRLIVWNQQETDTLTKDSCIYVSPDVGADFGAVETLGIVPLTVQFIDSSLGCPTSWMWYFGDDSTSTGQHPIHTYDDTGHYNVKLVVSNETDTDSLIRYNYIQVFSEVVAEFSADPESGLVPLEVQFTDLSDGNPTSWFWDFGDGDTDTLQNPTHTYNDTGYFDVKLVASNEADTDSIIKNNYIHVFPYVKDVGVSAILSPPDSIQVGLSYPLISEVTNYGIDPQTFNVIFEVFVSGSPEVEIADTFTITEMPGDFTVDTVTFNKTLDPTLDTTYNLISYTTLAGDENPSNDSTFGTSHSYSVVVADFSGDPRTGFAPLEVQFTDSSVGNPIAWFWDFGDDSTSTEQHPAHTYYDTGHYDVTLIVSNQIDSDTMIKSDYIYVFPPAVANFSADPESGYVPLQVQFTDLSEGNPTSWFWDFGDGDTDTVENPLHVYNDSGYFDVKLVVSDGQYFDSLIKEDYIHAIACPPDTCCADSNDLGNCDTLYIESWPYTDTCFIGYNPSGVWDTVCINEPGEPFPFFWYVSLFVTHDSNTFWWEAEQKWVQDSIVSFVIPLTFWHGPEGCADSVILPAPGPPDWWNNSKSFSPDPRMGRSIFRNIVDKSTGDTVYNRMLWLGDNYLGWAARIIDIEGHSSDGDSGHAWLALHAIDPSDRSWWEGSRVLLATYTFMVYPSETCDSFAIGLDSTLWPPASHLTFARYGLVSYFPRHFLPVKDTLSLHPGLHASFSADPTLGIVPLDVEFTDRSLGYPTSWLWDFGDDSSSTEQHPTHTYNDTGHYDVKLIVSNESETDSVIKYNFIQVFSEVVAEFSAVPESGFAPLEVQFTDLSIGNPLSWFWDFGDDSTSTAQHPTHTYNDTGYFDVKLIAANPVDFDTIIKENYIHVFLPVVADFTAEPESGLVPLEAQFTDLSVGNPTTWFWDFGDDSISTEQHPAHTYYDTGHYDVTLIVSNEIDSDTMIKPDYIAVLDTPIVDFDIDVTSGPINLEVHFSPSSSVTLDSAWWDYGDGTTGTDTFHTYTTIDTFGVRYIYYYYALVDTVLKEDAIITTAPYIDFIAYNTYGMAPLTVSFMYDWWGMGDSSSLFPTHAWLHLGNGDSIQLLNDTIPEQYTYTDPGYYDVTLHYFYEYYEDSIAKPGLVRVSTMNVDFAATPRYGISPLLVQFADQIEGTPTSLKWYFGDGDSSSDQNPSHIYGSSSPLPSNRNSEGQTTYQQLVLENHWKLRNVSKTPSRPIELAQPFPVSQRRMPKLTSPPDFYSPCSTYYYHNDIPSYYWRFPNQWEEDYRNTRFTVEGIYKLQQIEWMFYGGGSNCTGDGITVFVWSSKAGFPDRVIDSIDVACGDIIFAVEYPLWWIQDVSDRDIFVSGDFHIGYSVKDWSTDTVSIIMDDGENHTAWDSLRSLTWWEGYWWTMAFLLGEHDYSFLINAVLCPTEGEFFDITLIASDGTFTDTLTKPHYIGIFDTLTVDFTAEPIQGHETLTVSFEPLCSPTPHHLTWYFGDGDSSTEVNPVHEYVEAGSYEVKLVAELFGYKDSLTREDYIWVSDIEADFAADKRCGSLPLTVAFSDSSTSTFPITDWYWDFGDGETSDLQNPTHEFENAGLFEITLIVSDGIASDTLAKEDYIIAQDSVSADFAGFPTSGRSPLTVVFEPLLEGVANEYFWDFGDGDTSALRNPIHTYTTQGKYNVKLKVRLELDDCSQVDSMIKEEYVVVNDLEAQFSANPTAGIAPLEVQFTDGSSGDPDTWFWDFGDGNTSIDQSPLHQYDTAGVYDVFLRVSNSIGDDSLLKLNHILVDTAYADLFAEIYDEGGARPGFDLGFYFVWTNIGTTPAEDCTLRVLLPPEMTFYDLLPGDIRTGTYSGYSFSGDTIIIPLETIDPSDWYGGYVYAYGNLPDTIQIGDTLVSEMWLSTTTLEQNYDNNYVLHFLEVTGSIDPNDKLAYPGGQEISYPIEPDQRLEYAIRFENLPEATAEAIYIRVVDTLDQDLDWGTLAIGASSHPEECEYEFDPYTGEIMWFCDSIMLPPNENPPEGEGYFTFSISPEPDLPEGTEIANSAWIRFDYNEWLQAPEEGPVIRTIHSFIRGDANDDGIIDIGDVVYLINYLFTGTSAPDPLWVGDCNCDGIVDIGDVIYLINYLFTGTSPPGC